MKTYANLRKNLKATNDPKKPITPENITVLETIELTSKLLKCDYKIGDFNDMMVSIARVLEFYQLYSKDLVLDAAVGTRILQGILQRFNFEVEGVKFYLSTTGQLQLALQSFSLPSKIRLQLEELLKNSTSISDHVVGHFADVMRTNDQSEDGIQRRLLKIRKNIFNVIRFSRFLRCY